MARTIKIYCHPNIKKKEPIKVGGWPIRDEDATIELHHKNTSVSVRFRKDNIELEVYDMSESEAYNSLMKVTSPYASSYKKPDFHSSDRYFRSLFLHGKQVATIEDCCVIKSGRKKK